MRDHTKTPEASEALAEALAIDDILLQVRAEVMRAQAKHAPMHSGHEGYAVILEELEELFEDVRRDDLPNALKEAKQVAAMAVRFILDLGNET
jgi:hypothetical protein